MEKIQAGIKITFAACVFLISLFAFSQITRSYLAPRVLPAVSLVVPVDTAEKPTSPSSLRLQVRQGEAIAKIAEPVLSPRIASAVLKPRNDDYSNFLIAHDDLQASIGLLPYERIAGRGVRFRYTKIEGDQIGHAWMLAPRDLRGKTVRISYSGIVPREITFRLSRSSTSARSLYSFKLEDSVTSRTLAFTAPNKVAFDQVSLFEFVIEKDLAGRPYGDFLIESVEILDGDLVNRSALPSNPAPAFAFGSNHLQSNIWGGEVRS